MGGTCPGHYPHLPPGGPRRPQGAESLGWGRPRTWQRGPHSAGQRARREREPRAAGAAAGEGGGPGGAALPRGGSSLARKGAIVCSYSWYVRRARRP